MILGRQGFPFPTTQPPQLCPDCPIWTKGTRNYPALAADVPWMVAAWRWRGLAIPKELWSPLMGLPVKPGPAETRNRALFCPGLRLILQLKPGEFCCGAGSDVNCMGRTHTQEHTHECTRVHMLKTCLLLPPPRRGLPHVGSPLVPMHWLHWGTGVKGPFSARSSGHEIPGAAGLQHGGDAHWPLLAWVGRGHTFSLVGGT